MRCCRSPFGVTTGRGDGGAVGREFAPAGDLLFFAPPKKSRQKKGGPTGRVPFGATCDAHARGGAAELALFASLSPLKQRQRVSSRSAHASLRTRPTPCASRHGQKGFEDRTRAIAALGLGLFLLPLPRREGRGEGEPRRRRNKPRIGHQRLPVKREQLSKPESHAAVSRARCRAICACTCAGAVPPSVPRAFRLPRRLRGSNTSFSMAG